MVETIITSFRAPKSDIEKIKIVCRDRGEDKSDFIRRAIKKELANLGFYSDDVRRNLGITIKEAC